MTISVSNNGILSSNGGIIDEIGQYMTYYDEANTVLYLDATGRFSYSTNTGIWTNISLNTRDVLTNTSVLGAAVANTYGPNAMIFNNNSSTRGMLYYNANVAGILTPAIASPTGTGKMTASVWAYSTNWYTTLGQRIISATDNGGWSIALNDSGFTGTTSAGIVFYLAGVGYRYVEANTLAWFTSSTGWNHIAFTYNSADASTGKLYINGVLANSYSRGIYANGVATNTALSGGGNGLGIGAESFGASATTSPYWSGAIASILLSNRAYSSSEILDLFLKTDPNVSLPGSRTYVANTTTTVAPNIPVKYYSNGSIGTTGTTGFDEVTMNSGSLFFSSNASGITTPSNAAFTYTGDFCIEGWVFPISNTDGPRITLGTETTNRIVFFANTANTGYNIFGSSNVSLGNNTLVANQWNHFAFTRSGSTIRAFFNGVNTSATGTNAGTLGNGVGIVNIQGTSAYLTNVRIGGLNAKYTAAFTTQKSTMIEPESGTNFLLQSTNAASYLTDSSPYKFALTGGANTYYSPLGIGYLNNPPCGSLLFSGIQSLSLSSTPFQFSTNSFTVEAWIYPTAYDNVIIDNWVTIGYTTNQWQLWLTPGGVLTFAYATNSASYVSIGTGIPALNTWSHVAVVRNGSIITVYINGVASGSGVYAGTIGVTGSGTSSIGKQTTATPYYFYGYMSNIRMINGTALYTSDFTPPKQVLSAITNTSLLLKVANSSSYITDSSINAYTITNNGALVYQPFMAIASLGEAQKIYGDGTLAVANYLDDTNLTNFSATYSIGTAGTGGSGASNGTAGGSTTFTYSDTTLTGGGGGAGLNNTNTTVLGGTYSGGNGGSNGGNSSAVTGDRGGSSGGAIGGGGGVSQSTSGTAGASAADVSGLFNALYNAGYSPGTGGSAGGTGSSSTANINNGGNATGVGAGGGSAGWFGGNGGNGTYGGGGGGAAGYTGTQTGGTGGAGFVLLKITAPNDISTYQFLTSGTTFSQSLASGTIVKAWTVGAGGGGGGCGAVDATSASGGGAGGVAYKTFYI